MGRRGYCYTIHALTLKNDTPKKRLDAALLYALENLTFDLRGSLHSSGPQLQRQLALERCLVDSFSEIVLEA